MGTEIHTFTPLKDLSEYVLSQTMQYKSMFEDYSQWLGTVLRDCESGHKDEEWFKKSAAAQKNLKGQSKAPPVVFSKLTTLLWCGSLLINSLNGWLKYIRYE